jgi:O-antigen/teichoic acid export membrane protein
MGWLGAEDLGIYVVCLSAARVLNLFEASLSTVILPKVAGKPPDEASALVGTLSRLTFFSSALFAFGLAATLPWLIPHVYGRGFERGIMTSEILLIEAVFGCTTNILLHSYLALNRPAIVTLFQFAALGLAIPMMVILIPRFGLTGAALALLASTMVRYLVAKLGYQYILGLKIPGFILTRADLAYLLHSISLRTGDR